jgi:hypothetical protein
VRGCNRAHALWDAMREFWRRESALKLVWSLMLREREDVWHVQEGVALGGVAHGCWGRGNASLFLCHLRKCERSTINLTPVCLHPFRHLYRPMAPGSRQ